MTPEELADRLARLDEQVRQTQEMFATHIRDEEAQFALIAADLRLLTDVFVGAKGAAKVLSWLIAGLATLGSLLTWGLTHLRVN